MAAVTAAAPNLIHAPITPYEIDAYDDCPLEFLRSRDRAAPKRELDAQAKVLINAARETRRIAQQRFADKTTAAVPTHDYLTRRIDATEAALANPAVQAIFDGVFVHYDANSGNREGVEIRVDQIVRQGLDVFDLTMVKADNSVYVVRRNVSTVTGEITEKRELDPRLLRALALQLFVLERNGLTVGRTAFTHVNPEYEHPGGYRHDEKEFLRDVDVPKETLRAFYPEIEAKIAAMNELLAADDPAACDHAEGCPKAKKEMPLWDVRLLRPNKALRERLAAAGITDMRDIPDNFDADVKNKAKRFSDKQWLMIRAVKSGAMRMDAEAVTEELKAFGKLLETPGAFVSFLDYETIQPIVPVFKGARPFDYNTLQFSNHKVKNLESLDDESAVEHDEFIYQSGREGDWAMEITDKLLSSVGEAGPIVTWFQAFEIGRTTELADIMKARGETERAAKLYALVGGDKKALINALADKAGNADIAAKIRTVADGTGEDRENMAKYLRNIGEKELADELDAIRKNNGRIVDLFAIVRDLVYHPDFHGSASLKQVLPALTGISYTDLDDEVNVGIEASLALAELLNTSTAPGRRAELLKKLRDYCGLDTYSEVLILRVILKALKST